MPREWEPMLTILATQRYPRLVSHAMMLVGSRTDAEDLVQEALVATFVGRRTFEGLGQAEQYVRRAIVTKFVDRARKSGRERKLWDRAASAGSVEAGSDHGAAVGAMVDVGVALRTLPPRQRACVALRYLDDLTVPQTASLLGLSDGAVKRYVSDGLRTLGTLMGTDEILDDAEWLVVHPSGGGDR